MGKTRMERKIRYIYAKTKKRFHVYIQKTIVKLIMAIICWKMWQTIGMGKPFKRAAELENVTAKLPDEIMLAPVSVFIEPEHDRYYFAFRGKLVGCGRLDGKSPEEIIPVDCLMYKVLYSYILLWSINDDVRLDKLRSNSILRDGLMQELSFILAASKKKV